MPSFVSLPGQGTSLSPGGVSLQADTVSLVPSGAAVAAHGLVLIAGTGGVFILDTSEGILDKNVLG